MRPGSSCSRRAKATAGSWGRETAAVHADVHLDEDVDAHARSRGCGTERQRIARTFYRHQDRRAALHERDQALDLARSHHLIGDQDIVHAGGGHCLGIAQLGAGHAECPGRQFLLGDGRHLDALGMRPPIHAMPSHKARHVADVRFHNVQVNQQGRRIQLLYRLTDERTLAGHGSSSYVAR